MYRRNISHPLLSPYVNRTFGSVCIVLISRSYYFEDQQLIDSVTMQCLEGVKDKAEVRNIIYLFTIELVYKTHNSNLVK